MLLKCCTHYINKSGKLSNGHRTGKGQFLFWSQRRAMPKNAQTIVQLLSFHMLSRLARLQLYLSQELSNVQARFRKDKRIRDQIAKICWIIEKAEKFQTSSSASLTMLKPLIVWIQKKKKKCGKSLKRREITLWEHVNCLLRNLYAGQERTVSSGHETTDWFKIWKGASQGCILSPC